MNNIKKTTMALSILFLLGTTQEGNTAAIQPIGPTIQQDHIILTHGGGGGGHGGSHGWHGHHGWHGGGHGWHGHRGWGWGGAWVGGVGCGPGCHWSGYWQRCVCP